VRFYLLLVLPGAALAACAPPPGDLAFLRVNLPPAYASLPAAPDGAPIDPGVPVKLDPRQQEAVVVGVLKWMKDPRSAAFGDIAAAKNRNGSITACGEVNGSNTAGVHAGMTPFIGVLMGKPAAPEFVTVEIGALRSQRADVEALCRESGAARTL
jgi:hypothetical protein